MAEEPDARSGPRWSAGAVARMLGISPTTLRTWDRRYGLGPSTREEGKHRRYDSADVDRLRRMLELTGQGVAPAAAAAGALSGAAPDSTGTRTTPIVRAAAERRGFTRAANRLDAPLMRRLAVELIGEHGVVNAWEQVFSPFLVALGERTVELNGGVEVEHVATSSIVAALRLSADVPEGGRLPALLACAPEEQHSLPLEALGAALVERGCAFRNLGARVPATALLDAVALLSPAAVVVWAHTAEHARLVPLPELGDVDTAVLVGGPGWPGLRLPAGVERVSSLDEAISGVLRHSGRSADATR
ncbi:MerR family transcriptional regulator [Umezawaea beigongshangensis]|uniref:MerR family transcriptional regulator n=1 Tax=Umezawaea beigongshangensis TaxID=2780383 RepID=UPI0027DC0BCA|nr:MerR family transcriptional regulator [Umezawaea beigongshangensis]